MNRRQKHAKAGGGWQRPSVPLVNNWLKPEYKWYDRRHPRPRCLDYNKWEHGTRRFQEAAWKRERKAEAKELLALGGVKVKAEYICDMPFEDYGTIEHKEPHGQRWLDYVPLVGNREYRVASGYNKPGEYCGYFVPEYSFTDRLDWYRRSGMPRHDAWERARLANLEAAHKHLSNEASELHVTVTVDGEEFVDTWSWTEDYIDCNDPQDVLELVAEVEGLKWIISRVTDERAELAAGQVGPI